MFFLDDFDYPSTSVNGLHRVLPKYMLKSQPPVIGSGEKVFKEVHKLWEAPWGRTWCSLPGAFIWRDTMCVQAQDKCGTEILGGGPLQASREACNRPFPYGPRRRPTCWDLDLGIPDSRAVGKQMSLVSASQSGILRDGSPANQYNPQPNLLNRPPVRSNEKVALETSMQRSYLLTF